MILPSFFKLCSLLILFVAEIWAEYEAVSDHELSAPCLSLPTRKVKTILFRDTRVQKPVTSFQEEMLKRVRLMHSVGCTASVHKKRQKIHRRCFLLLQLSLFLGTQELSYIIIRIPFRGSYFFSFSDLF